MDADEVLGRFEACWMDGRDSIRVLLTDDYQREPSAALLISAATTRAWET
jgi:hypothetical protein